jgi:hypothetical protein
VSQSSQPGVLPLRPQSAGELLDAGVALLRTRWRLLLGLGLLLATAEQVLLFPLRRLADLDLRYWPADDRWRQWALLVIVGFAAEAFLVALLGGVAARGTPRALLGAGAPAAESPARPALGVLVAAVAVAVTTGLALLSMYAWPVTFFLLVPVTLLLWVWAYGAFGFAAVTVVLERRGPAAALARSVVLAHRGFLRALRIRVVAYLGWWLIRLAWGLGVLSLLGLFYTPPDTTMDNVVMAGVFLMVNALAYPMLGCLDAVLHTESRMRTEGLDIALRRSLARRVDPGAVLAPVGPGR